MAKGSYQQAPVLAMMPNTYFYRDSRPELRTTKVTKTHSLTNNPAAEDFN